MIPKHACLNTSELLCSQAIGRVRCQSELTKAKHVFTEMTWCFEETIKVLFSQSDKIHMNCLEQTSRCNDHCCINAKVHTVQKTTLNIISAVKRDCLWNEHARSYVHSTMESLIWRQKGGSVLRVACGLLFSACNLVDVSLRSDTA